MKIPPYIHAFAMLVLALSWIGNAAFARSCRITLIPNGRINGCSNCHINPLGGGRRTPFGEDVRPLVSAGSCSSFWGPALAALDSDGDGRTNGEELGDPRGVWSSAFPQPGNPADVTNPGVPDDFTAGEIEVTPGSLIFGKVFTGSTLSMDVELRNLGDGALEILGVSFAAGSSGAFELATPFDPFSLAPKATARISVEFTPTADGAHDGALVVTSDDDDEASVEVSLSGTAVPEPLPRILLSPPRLLFGEVLVGSESSMGLEVRNGGTAPLHVSGASFSATSSSAFSLAKSFESLELEPDETRVLELVFAPLAVESATGELILESDDPDLALARVALSGSGVPVPTPRIELSRTLIEYGVVTVDNSSTKRFEMRNVGTAPLVLSSVMLGPRSSPDFVVSEGGGATTLAPGSALTVAVRYTPSDVGPDSGTVLVESNDPSDAALVVSLRGSGVAEPVPDIDVSPVALDFGDVFVDESAALPVIISNLGRSDLTITAIDLGGKTSSAFEITMRPASSSVPPDSSLETELRFAPLAPGEFLGTIRIESDDPDEPLTEISLSGRSTGTRGVPFLRSDANADGESDVSDAIYVLSFLFTGGAAPTCAKTADANDSGEADVSDVIYHLAGRFLGGPQPPPPFDACGTDPTPDRLGCESYAPCG